MYLGKAASPWQGPKQVCAIDQSLGGRAQFSPALDRSYFATYRRSDVPEPSAPPVARGHLAEKRFKSLMLLSVARCCAYPLGSEVRFSG